MRRAESIAIALLLAAGSACAAPQVACHLTYGGQTQTVTAPATSDPYSVGDIGVGTYFRFRIVFRDQPADLAGIKIYTAAVGEPVPLPLHQASYPYPLPHYQGGDFTGRQIVLEPKRDTELDYWCELRAGDKK